jgi:hypothetical protein
LRIWGRIVLLATRENSLLKITTTGDEMPCWRSSSGVTVRDSNGDLDRYNIDIQLSTIETQLDRTGTSAYYYCGR